MFRWSRPTCPCSRLIAVASLAGLFATASCHEPAAPAAFPQDSVVVAVPTLTLAVEVAPATIAVGDTATIRVSATNRSTTPVTLVLHCASDLGYRVETQSGELAAWVSQPVCMPAVTRVRFTAGEVRVLEFRLPRPGPVDAPMSPGEYQVRATFGLFDEQLRSTPVRLVVTSGR
jgi:hypothetical protein